MKLLWGIESAPAVTTTPGPGPPAVEVTMAQWEGDMMDRQVREIHHPVQIRSISYSPVPGVSKDLTKGKTKQKHRHLREFLI